MLVLSSIIVSNSAIEFSEQKQSDLYLDTDSPDPAARRSLERSCPAGTGCCLGTSAWSDLLETPSWTDLPAGASDSRD